MNRKSYKKQYQKNIFKEFHNDIFLELKDKYKKRYGDFFTTFEKINQMLILSMFKSL